MMTLIESRLDRLERLVGENTKNIQQLSDEIREFKEGMVEFREGMVEFKEGMVEFKDKVDDHIRQSNLEWGRLSNRLGTLVEDIIIPNLPLVIDRVFGLKDPEFVGAKLKRKQKGLNLEGEVDAIIAYQSHVFVNESKSTVTRKKAEKFRRFLDERFLKLFPSFEGKVVVPVFSSNNLTDDQIEVLTDVGIFAVRVFGDILEFENLEKLRSRFQL